jgi:hypothetical protein
MDKHVDNSAMVEVSREQVNTISTEPVRLKWSEKDRTVVFETSDKDLFTMKVKEVIQACNILQQQSNKFESQFNDLKNILGNWVHERKNKIVKAFVTVRDTRILFIAITKDVEYDGVFEDELTALDWAIAHTELLSAIPLSVQSLPQCDSDIYQSFLSPPLILEYTE